MAMDFRQLRYFLTVAKTGSFTAAARALDVAQPAVSIAIRKLESQLEVSLFHRDERKAGLTDEGQLLFDQADRIMQLVEDAELAMAELKGLTRGEVRIGLPGMLGSYFFPPVLMAFKSRYPNIKLSVIEGGTRHTQELIDAGELDLGVVISDQVSQNLNTQKLIAEELVVCVGADHALAKEKSITPDQLFAEDLVLFKSGAYQREFVENLAKTNDLIPKVAFETELITLSKELIRHGFCAGVFIRMAVKNDETLVAIPFAEPAYLDTSLAWRKEGYLTHAERAFLDFVTEEIGDHRC